MKKIEPCNCVRDQERFEELVRRTIADCKRVSYRDVGHKCESRKVVEKISQRFADYQKGSYGN